MVFNAIQAISYNEVWLMLRFYLVCLQLLFQIVNIILFNSSKCLSLLTGIITAMAPLSVTEFL